MDGIDIFIVADAAGRDEAAGCAEACAGAGLAAQVLCDTSARGPAALRNQALRSSSSELVLLLDARARPQGDWLEPLARAVREDARVAAAGGVSLHPDTRKVLQAGVRLGADLHPLYDSREEFYEFFDAGKAERLPHAVSGHCLLLRRAEALEAGGFDEAYRGQFDDVDFCLRLRARGHQVALAPESVAHHREPSRLKGLAHRRDDLERLRRTVEGSDALKRLAWGAGAAAPAPRAVASLLYPAFNDAAFLEENIESIVNQTYRDWELVVVNDASTDDATPGILDAYAAAYPGRVRVIHKENHDRLEAWDICYAESRGAYLAVLGADDVLLPWCLAEQTRALEGSPSVAFVYGDVYRFDGEGLLIDRVAADNPEPARQLARLMRASYVFTPSVLMRRAAVEAAGGWMKREFLYSQDYELWLRLLHGRGKAHVGRPVIKYRVHRAQLTSVAGNQKMHDCMAAVLRDKMARWRVEELFPALDLDSDGGQVAAYREMTGFFISSQVSRCGLEDDVYAFLRDLLARRAAGPEARRAKRELLIALASHYHRRGQHGRVAGLMWAALREGAAFERGLYAMLWNKARRLAHK